MQRRKSGRGSSFFKVVVAVYTGAIAALLTFLQPVRADISARLIEFLDNPGTQSRLALSGIGGGGGSLFAYMGLVQAFEGTINETGPLARIFLNTYGFDYSTTIAGRRRRIDATGYGGSVEGGYQWARPGLGRVAIFAGLKLRDHALSPDDPGSDLEDTRAGFAMTTEGAWLLAAKNRLSWSYSYVAGLGDYWLQTRAGHDFGRFTAGPEIVFFGGDDYRYQRYGAFASDIVIDLGPASRLFLTLEAGVQRDAEDGDTSPYGGLHSSFFF